MAATNAEIIAFLDLISPLVLNEAYRRAYAGEGFVLPSIAIAQAAHETGWGLSDRMTASYALYGIKAGGSWTGPIFNAETWEVAPNGEAYNTSANFRAYSSYAESVADYFDFIAGPRYASALSTRDNMLTAQETIDRIFAGGYATDPPYPGLIMDMIAGRDLTQYDVVLADMIGANLPPEEQPGGSIGDYNPPTVDPSSYIKYVFEKI